MKRTVAYAASSVMPGSSVRRPRTGRSNRARLRRHPTPVSPSANPGPPIDLVYPVVPGPPKPVNKGRCP
ncbi:MAG: hypothetical protein ACLSAH_22550 [Bilophila wadsworthia]